MRAASEPFVTYLAESVARRLGATWGVGEGGATGPRRGTRTATLPAIVWVGSARGGCGRAVRCIGLLGGMSWESSFEYERMSHEGVRERRGGTRSADLIIRSYDYAAVHDGGPGSIGVSAAWA